MENRQKRIGIEEMDAVIVWTDTEEKKYRRMRIEYLRSNPGVPEAEQDSRNREEFFLTIGGIIRNLPHLRKLFVISVVPVEGIAGFMEENFPKSGVEIVNIGFEELLEGMEGFLPCFSTISAVTMLYRLNNLDERFLLFNVGCIPLREIDMTAFEREDRSIFYGKKRRSHALSGKDSEKILIPGRMPVLIGRKTIEDCLTANPGILMGNLRHRFDSPRSQIYPEGQTDLVILIANSPEALTVEDGDWRRDHGTMIQRLSPCDDRTFLRTIRKCSDAAFMDLAPLNSFPESQRWATTDFLCHKLQIRLP